METPLPTRVLLFWLQLKRKKAFKKKKRYIVFLFLFLYILLISRCQMSLHKTITLPPLIQTEEQGWVEVDYVKHNDANRGVSGHFVLTLDPSLAEFNKIPQN